MIKSSCFLLVFLLALPAFGEPNAELISSTARLRKLSLSFRGTLPTESEYEEIKRLNIQVNNQDFFRMKAQAYAESESFAERTLAKIFDHLRIRQTGSTNYSERSQLEKWVKAAIRERKWDDILGSEDLRNLTSVSYYWDVLQKIKEEEIVDKAKMFWELSTEQEALAILLEQKAVPQSKGDLDRKQALIEIRNWIVSKDATWNTKLKIDAPLGALSAQLISALIQLEDDEKISFVEKAQTYKKITFVTKEIAEIDKYRPRLSRERINTLRVAPELAFRIYNDLNRVQKESLPNLYSSYEKAIFQAFRAAPLTANQKVGLTATDEFRNRFIQTPYSQSAAYYRIYFCDDMKAVAITKGGLEATVLNGIFRNSNTRTSDTPSFDTSEQRHASEPQCQTCHRKMDVVKRTFTGPFPMGGEVVKYDSFDGIEQSFTIQSARELIPKTLQQPTYKQCQTKSIWGWIVGENIPISKAKSKELTDAYAKSSSLKEFLVEMSLQSAFYTIPETSKIVTFESVRPIFQRCNSCHQNEGTIPNYAQLPFSIFGTTPQQKHDEHLKSIRNIVKQTGLFHGGRDAQMPSKDSGWRLDKEQELELIAKWVLNKAQDGKGRPTISDIELAQILAEQPTAEIQRISRLDFMAPTFRNTWKRYLGDKAIFQSALSQVIGSSMYDCFNGYSEEVFGGSNIMTGKYNLNEMSATTLNTIMICTEAAMKRSKQSTYYRNNVWSAIYNNRGNVFYTSPSFLSDNAELKKILLEIANKERSVVFRETGAWNQVPTDSQRKITSAIINAMIGPEVVTYEQMYIDKLLATLTVEANDRKSEVFTVPDALHSMVMLIASDDEFLAY